MFSVVVKIGQSEEKCLLRLLSNKMLMGIKFHYLLNGTVYNVDKLSDVRHFSSVPTETETRYTVLIGQRHTYLFEKNNRWYVEAKA